MNHRNNTPQLQSKGRIKFLWGSLYKKIKYSNGVKVFFMFFETNTVHTPLFRETVPFIAKQQIFELKYLLMFFETKYIDLYSVRLFLS